MKNNVTIALDLMGGDNGPDVSLSGAQIMLERRPGISFLFFGDESMVLPLLDKYPDLKKVNEFCHCDVTIGMDDKPSQALRNGRGKSSMWCAIDAVREGRADVAVSAGNTGALMAMSTFCLRTMPGISRPAIAGIWPTMRGETIILDLGATIGVDEDQLVSNAFMGAAMARTLYALERPTVGLLNIGAEEVKGLDGVRQAGQRLRDGNYPMFDYFGFVEGDDLGKGTTDVVVTEGFSGNIALKTAEGTAKQISHYLKESLGRSIMARIGYMFARNALKRLRDRMDPRKVNGGVFLGLNGLVVKSHGGTDAEGMAAAIDLGFDMARSGLQERLAADLKESAHKEAENSSVRDIKPGEAAS